MNDRTISPVRLALGGMAGMAVCMGIGRFVFTPILPVMMEQAHVSPFDAGLVAAANYGGYLAGAMVSAGGWAHGRERTMVVAGLAASTGLAAAMAFVDTLAAFLVIRFLAGFASAVVMVFLASIVSTRIAAAGRPGLQAVHFAGVGVGISVSSLMLAGLIFEDAPWQWGWLGAALLSAIGTVVALGLVSGGPHVSGEGRAEPRLPNDPALKRVIVAYGLFGFGYIVTATFLVAIVRAGGAGRLFEPLVWLLTGLAIIPSIWLLWRLSARFGLLAAFSAGCLVEAVGVAASVLLPVPAGPIIGGILLGATFVAVTAIGLQAGRALAPASPRRTLGLMTAAFGVGQIVGPVAAGFVAEWSGDFLLASLLAAATLLACAAIVWPVREAAKLP
jgi:MFS family permease